MSVGAVREHRQRTAVTYAFHGMRTTVAPALLIHAHAIPLAALVAAVEVRLLGATHQTQHSG